MKKQEVTVGKELITLNDLCSKCGFFGADMLEYLGDALPNNGYICSHPKQEEKENGFGLCHRWSCPIACTATMSDLRELDEDLYEQYRNEFPNDDDIPEDGEDWMVWEHPEAAKAIPPKGFTGS